MGTIFAHLGNHVIVKAPVYPIWVIWRLQEEGRGRSDKYNAIDAFRTVKRQIASNFTTPPSSVQPMSPHADGVVQLALLNRRQAYQNRRLVLAGWSVHNHVYRKRCIAILG